MEVNIGARRSHLQFQLFQALVFWSSFGSADHNGPGNILKQNSHFSLLFKAPVIATSTPRQGRLITVARFYLELPGYKSLILNPLYLRGGLLGSCDVEYACCMQTFRGIIFSAEVKGLWLVAMILRPVLTRN